MKENKQYLYGHNNNQKQNTPHIHYNVQYTEYIYTVFSKGHSLIN